MSEEIQISEMFVELELEELQGKFVWAENEFTLAKFVSMVSTDKSKIKILLESIPMYLLEEYALKRFHTVIYTKRKVDFISQFLDFNLTSKHVIELVKVFQAFKQRPPATLTFYHIIRPKNFTSNQMLNKFLEIPNARQLKEWYVPARRYGISFIIKNLQVKLLENLELNLSSGENKEFYAIYNPKLDWIGISSSKITDLYECIRFLKKYLKVQFLPFNFGKKRTSIPDVIRPDFWLKFFHHLDDGDKFLDPRINLTFLTDPTDRSIKKYSISSYREVKPNNTEFQRDIKEELSKGLWIEGIRGSIIYDKKTKLHLYIRDYKKRTTFSLLRRPRDFTIEEEIWALSQLFEEFSQFISPFLEQSQFSRNLDDYF